MKNHQAVLLRLFKILEAYKPQKKELYEYLEEAYKAEYYPYDKILYEQGEVIKDIFFLASGTAVAYSYTDNGDKQLLHIYRENEFIAGQSFTHQTPSLYHLMVCADSFMLHMASTQLKILYEKFPVAEELARFRLSATEAKELRYKKMMILPGIQMVEAFYNEYPELLEPGKVLRDREVASYLLLAESTLRGLRNELLRLGRLKIPAKGQE